MEARYQIQSRAGATGAIGLIEVRGEVGAALDAIGASGVAIGRVGLRHLRTPGTESGRGVEALVARWSKGRAHLMPHAGGEIMRACEAILERAGLRRTDRMSGPGFERPSREQLAELLEVALASASSPLAIDVLLRQPARWNAVDVRVVSEAHARALDRLIDAPLVVAWGPSNVGKSTLLNAMASEEVSIVADEPGTTRDHVGVMLDLAGVVVRYVDTPGVRADAGPIEAEAVAIAAEWMARADLVLWCRDAGSERPTLANTCGIVLEVELRSDLGVRPGGGLAVSARDRRSIQRLALVIREALVPLEAVLSERAWRFWERAEVRTGTTDPTGGFRSESSP